MFAHIKQIVGSNETWSTGGGGGQTIPPIITKFLVKGGLENFCIYRGFRNTVNDRYSKPYFDIGFTLLYSSVYNIDQDKQMTNYSPKITSLYLLPGNGNDQNFQGGGGIFENFSARGGILPEVSNFDRKSRFLAF